MEKSDLGKLWTKELKLICTSNFFLFFSLYILLPIFPFFLSDKFNISLTVAGGITVVYVLSLFLIGSFYSFLIDTYKRKSVCLLSFLGIILSTAGYLVAGGLLWILVLRLLQGSMFGITVSMSTTLAIDTSHSPQRTSANCCQCKASRLGMVLGITCGLMFYGIKPIEFIFYISLIAGILGWLLISRLHIAFRAPIGSSICSLDRFVLPKGLSTGINLFFILVAFGLLISVVNLFLPLEQGALKATFFGSLVFVGMLITMFLRSIFHIARGKVIISGILWLFVSLLILHFNFFSSYSFLAGLLWGMGIEAVAFEFLLLLVGLSQHCQRGTAINTYFLCWELGIGVGFFLGCVLIHEQLGNVLFIIGMIVLLASLLFYRNKIDSFFCKNKTRNV